MFHPERTVAAARSAASRALALDDRCADAHAAMGAVLLMHQWDAAGAARSLDRALALNGNHTEALAVYGRLMDAVRRPERALGMKMKALERDPDSPFVHMEIALSHWHQRQYDLVLAWAEKTLALDPQHLLARELVASVHWKRGDFDRHLAEAIVHARSFGVPDEAFADLRRAQASGGRRAVIAYSIEQMARHPQPAQHVQLALLRGELGEMDGAFAHLDAAIDVRDPSLVYLGVAPQWDHLRADARFDERVARVGLCC